MDLIEEFEKLNLRGNPFYSIVDEQLIWVLMNKMRIRILIVKEKLFWFIKGNRKNNLSSLQNLFLCWKSWRNKV
jgi:hypothetical protein